MALDARDRASIYSALVPVLGEDAANKLMSQFPDAEADELVTRQFLRAELAELRSELAERLQRQTAWMAGTVLAGLALAASIASALN